MKGTVGVAEKVLEPYYHLERKAEKKLAVNSWTGKVNPYFYEDGKLTRIGELRLERLFREGQQRIQKKQEALKAEGRRIQQKEEQIKSRKEKFILEVKTFEERFKQPVYNDNKS